MRNLNDLKYLLCYKIIKNIKLFDLGTENNTNRKLFKRIITNIITGGEYFYTQKNYNTDNGAFWRLQNKCNDIKDKIKDEFYNNDNNSLLKFKYNE